MADFSLEDVDPNITESMRLHIADLILRWAAFDTAISYWMVQSFGLPMDASSILLGNMDTRTKLDKLFKLHQHFSHPGTAAIGRLRKQHEKHVEARNIVAHQRCAGHLKSDPDYMVFHSIRHVAGALGEFEIVCVPLDVMRLSTFWAGKAEQGVRSITDNMTGPIAKSGEPSA